VAIGLFFEATHEPTPRLAMLGRLSSLPDRHYRRSFRRRRAADRAIRRCLTEGHPLVLLSHWECKEKVDRGFSLSRMKLLKEWECRH
jgi:hypothetical protein